MTCSQSGRRHGAQRSRPLHAAGGRVPPSAVRGPVHPGDGDLVVPSARTAARSALPLTTVRYQIPGLDAQNQARAGTTVHAPVWLERQPGATAARVTRLTVQESADGGRTWRAVPLARTGDHWAATIANPTAPGYVALRATVADSAGDTATQTILRVYAVTRRGSSR